MDAPDQLIWSWQTRSLTSRFPSYDILSTGDTIVLLRSFEWTNIFVVFYYKELLCLLADCRSCTGDRRRFDDLGQRSAKWYPGAIHNSTFKNAQYQSRCDSNNWTAVTCTDYYRWVVLTPNQRKLPFIMLCYLLIELVTSSGPEQFSDDEDV